VSGDAELHADFPLLIEVYPVRSEREVKELYLEVNKVCRLPSASAASSSSTTSTSSTSIKTFLYRDSV